MFPINVADSATATRLSLILCCPNPECRHESNESFVRLHGRYMLACRECDTTIDLKAKEYRVILDELVEFCRRTDALLSQID